MPQPVEKAKGALTHKVGPLPLWGWAVAGVAAVIVVKKFTGGGGGGSVGPGLVTIPPGASLPAPGSVAATDAIGSPSGNAQGGTPSQPTGTPPWWATPPSWLAIGAPLAGQPSTNGSAGAGPATTTPTGAPPPAATSWWTRLINPSGNLPAGAAVTTIAGTTYSLSSDALARAGIAGAAAPTAAAAPRVSTTASSPTGTRQDPVTAFDRENS